MNGDPLRPILQAEGVVLLDGGLATELERRGADLDDPLWSGRVLLEEPQRIAEVHRAFSSAGADVVTTATYQITYEGLARRGLDAGAAGDLMRRAVDLALGARDWILAEATSRTGPLVAASIGPFGAFLADGSEYRGDYGLSTDELARFHRPRIELLAGSAADLLACETIPSLAEAQALAEVLAELPHARAWISFSCRDDRHVSHGERLSACVAAVESLPQVVAVGVNCVPPSRVLPLLEEARRATDKPLLAYPNSGEHYPGGKTWAGCAESPDELAARAAAWVEAGARLIGGCCRTGPEHITALYRWRASSKGGL